MRLNKLADGRETGYVGGGWHTRRTMQCTDEVEVKKNQVRSLKAQVEGPQQEPCDDE